MNEAVAVIGSDTESPFPENANFFRIWHMGGVVLGQKEEVGAHGNVPGNRKL